MKVDGSIRLFDQPYRLDVQRSCADERLGAGCTESSTAECNTRRGFCLDLNRLDARQRLRGGS